MRSANSKPCCVTDQQTPSHIASQIGKFQAALQVSALNALQVSASNALATNVATNALAANVATFHSLRALQACHQSLRNYRRAKLSRTAVKVKHLNNE